MNSFRLIRSVLFSIFPFVLMASCQTAITEQEQASQTLEWPAITKETKPWTRWWWQGSAVSKEGITAELEAFKEAGLGGVEITPIYGVYGYEDQFIEYLSPEWTAILIHTLNEAERLGLGVDMATGTGWPFGGPWIGNEDACKDMHHKTYTVNGGESVREPIIMKQEPFVRVVGTQIYETHHSFGVAEDDAPAAIGTLKEPLLKKDAKAVTIDQLVEPVASNKDLQALALDQVKFEKPMVLQALMAYSSAGQVLELTNKVDENGKLDWVAPQGSWTLYAVFQGWHGKMVERAAPGGEGNVMDHYSKAALTNYLKKFDESFSGHNISPLRGFFNDSYEVDDARGTANFTPTLFEEFKKRRGYDLKNHLPALFGNDSKEKNERVLSDYRETLSELILNNFTLVWKEWAHDKGAIIRNQAHGSPANILDLYEAVDIPEIEGVDALRIKMASSAANVSGKKLISSESATWLNEHFKSNLHEIKKAVDLFMFNGVNHVFYHGSNYSSPEEAWPGWLFYAAVHTNPRNSLWTDFGALNDYIARCQSFLQSSKADNDILLYYPIYDRFSTPGEEMIEHFDGVNENWDGTVFKEDAEWLLERGYAFDYISDNQIQKSEASDKQVRTTGNQYKTVVLPHSRYIPLETFSKLVDLAEGGATVVVHKGLPGKAAGFDYEETNEKEFTRLKGLLNFSAVGKGVEEAKVGSGSFISGDKLEQLLEHLKVKREAMVDKGLQFVRKRSENGSLYFISNWTDKKVDTWVPLETDAQNIALFNPNNGKAGLAESRIEENGLEVYLQLEPFESILVKADHDEMKGVAYDYYNPSGEPQPLNGSWKIDFIAGGPTLPPSTDVSQLGSWTDLPGEEVKKFSGTAQYSITFKKPEGNTDHWLLDLGVVKESASVSLNGEDLGTLIGPSYKLYLDDSKLKAENQLVVKVSNLMANRIADLDQRDVFWKKFYNINFPARLSQNRQNGLFTAAHWEPTPSGLLGPVTLTQVSKRTP